MQLIDQVAVIEDWLAWCRRSSALLGRCGCSAK